jgi:hypothetical protein
MSPGVMAPPGPVFGVLESPDGMDPSGPTEEAEPEDAPEPGLGMEDPDPVDDDASEEDLEPPGCIGPPDPIFKADGVSEPELPVEDPDTVEEPSEDVLEPPGRTEPVESRDGKLPPGRAGPPDDIGPPDPTSEVVGTFSIPGPSQDSFVSAGSIASSVDSVTSCAVEPIRGRRLGCWPGTSG